ncbi:glucokinase regulator family protein [Penicillium soppii]|jgi:N-acetylmuramic acid 6-phosphate etherase|uniref:glucokinase regulator family protein n=1 Tax=Penicillium soppii TaxID=69789 RepID=UPI00254769D5|nr:glucokinase regulator family protein [Penicillium soppii]KAJ5882403.1 glucokinase regulator family protein [Penicillium soppii]
MTPFNCEGLGALQTEVPNVLAPSIDVLDTLGLCKAFNSEEAKVAPAIACCLSEIASLIEALVPRLRAGGRVIYVGAGNSGRLGFMECSELPVTFSTDEGQFHAIVAGGEQAILKAKEEAEDSEQDGSSQLEVLRVSAKDTVLGISASGRTPFVCGALKVAIEHGALTAAITNTYSSVIEALGVNHSVAALVGPEFIAGSTRLKAGSATKQILNMISTCAMVKLGKTHMGLMIDLRARNYKLQARGRRIIQQVCKGRPLYILDGRGQPQPRPLRFIDASQEDAALDNLITKCGGNVKLACAVAVSGLAPAHARHTLDRMEGNFRLFLESIEHMTPKCNMEYAGNEELFLSIDGGGTKCAVSIATRSQVIAQGWGGPCNFHSVPLDDLLGQIQIATLQAVSHLSQTYRYSDTQLPKFAAVWAGIAGLHHANQREALSDGLEKLLNLSSREGVLRLTSDSALLSACIGINDSVDRGIAVIAGTGSVATAFSKDPTGEFIQIGRAGGWGPLIGDQGSAFDIGKQALRALLSSLELSQGTEIRLTELESEILASVGHAKDELLSGILFSDLQPKYYISDIAKVVTKLGFRKVPDLQALEILTSAARSVVQLIKPLAQKHICDPNISSLILTGALMNLPNFQALITGEMAREQVPSFKAIVVVDNASAFAAQYLAQRAQGQLFSKI